MLLKYNVYIYIKYRLITAPLYKLVCGTDFIRVSYHTYVDKCTEKCQYQPNSSPMSKYRQLKSGTSLPNGNLIAQYNNTK